MDTKAKKYYMGEWKYDDYTPEWVKPLIRKRYGIEIVTMDQANHPLNEKKAPHNLNTPYQYYRQPEYPFWVCGREIDKALLSCFEAGEEMTKEDFLIIIKEKTQHVYRYFCRRWFVTTAGDCYKDMRQALIEASKGM